MGNRVILSREKYLIFYGYVPFILLMLDFRELCLVIIVKSCFKLHCLLRRTLINSFIIKMFLPFIIGLKNTAQLVLKR